MLGVLDERIRMVIPIFGRAFYDAKTISCGMWHTLVAHSFHTVLVPSAVQGTLYSLTIPFFKIVHILCSMLAVRSVTDQALNTMEDR